MSVAGQSALTRAAGARGVPAADVLGHATVRVLKPTPSTLFVGVGPGGFVYARPAPGGAVAARPGSVPWQQFPPGAIPEELERRGHRVDWFPAYCVTALAVAVGLFVVALVSLAANAVLGVLVLIGSVLGLACVGYGGYKVLGWNRERRELSVVYDVGQPVLYERAAAASGVGEALAGARVVSMTVFPDVARVPARFCVDGWPLLRTNVQLWCAYSVGQSVLFLPDQLILKLGGRTMGVPYSQLSVTSSWHDSGEIHGVPADAQVVGRTWRHTRKDGAPDLRFRDNPQVLIVRYGRLSLGLPNGALLTFMISSLPATELAESLLRFLASPITPPLAERTPEPARPAALPPGSVGTVGTAPARVGQQPPPGPARSGATQVLSVVQAPGPAAPPVPPIAATQAGASPIAARTPAPRPSTLGSDWIARAAASQAAAPSEKERAPKVQAAPACRWYGPGETAHAAGFQLPGLVYVGTELASQSWDQRGDAALINPRLPVAGQERALEDYPHFAELAPGTRGRYLKWHQEGRSSRDADIGFVFLFFFGLERRILVDLPRDQRVRAELPAIRSELERLLSLYGGNDAFRQYATSLLDWIRATDDAPPRYLQPPDPGWGRWQRSIELELALGQLVRDGRPLDAEWAYAWWSAWPEARVRTPATRCPELMRELFGVRYRDKYGTGITIQPVKARLEVSHRPASPTLRSVPVRTLGEVPAVMSQRGVLRKLEALADQCQDELDPYSRWVGRNAQGDGLAGAALLPAEIAGSALPEAARSYVDGLRTALVGPEGLQITKADDLIRIWTGKDGDKLSAKDAASATEWLQRQGIGVEPDARTDSKPLSAGQSIAFFAAPRDGSPGTGPAVSSAATLVNLAALVVMADGVAHPNELASIDAVLESWQSLAPADVLRLKARFRLRVLAPPKLTALRKRVEHLTSEGRAALGKVLASIAAADSEVSTDELKLLTKLYDVLGLDPERLFSELHAADTAPRDAEPVVVQRSRGDGRGHPIPPPFDRAAEGSPRLRLDMARIAHLRTETERVAEILSDVFEEDPAPATVHAAPSVAAGETAIDGLDAAEMALVRRLAELEQVSAGDLGDLGEECGVAYPAPVLEKVNEIAFDRLDQPAFEDGDPIVITQTVLRELLK